MAVARTNPLAPGVYWIDVWAPDMFAPKHPNSHNVMVEWLEQNGERVIEEHEDFHDGTKDRPLPARWFYKFQVLSTPTPFPFKELGFPTIRKLGEPSQITPADTAFGSADTVHKLPPATMSDIFSEALTGVSPWLLAGLVLLLISQFKESKK